MLGEDAIEVNRKTRILFNNSYFDYPLTPLNALFGLVIFESIKIGFSYIFARIKSLIGFYFPHDTPEEMGPTRIQAGSHLFSHPGIPRNIIIPNFINAGTFILLHFDIIHAAWINHSYKDRYMIKFVFSSTNNPKIDQIPINIISNFPS